MSTASSTGGLSQSEGDVDPSPERGTDGPGRSMRPA
jgi:hypothetical protein